MITYLASHRLGRILLIPAVILCGALSFAAWFSTKNEQDRARLQDGWGWWGPKMADAWTRLETTTSVYEDLKNLGSEYAKSDGQRTYKAMSFTMVCAVMLVGALAGLLL